MIEGDPEAIEAAARELRRAAAAFDEKSADVIRHANEVTAEWTGTAADAARDRITFLGRRLLIARDVNEDAATAWEHYAAELRIAQREYAEGLAQRDTAQAQQLQLHEHAAAAPAPDPAQDALLAAAGRQVAGGQHAMDAAVEREQVANGVAARALDALVDELSTMTATSPAPEVPVVRPAGPKPEESWWSDNAPGANDWADFGNGVLMLPRNSAPHAEALQQRALAVRAHLDERHRELKAIKGRRGIEAERRYVRALRAVAAARAEDYALSHNRATSFKYPLVQPLVTAANTPLYPSFPTTKVTRVLHNVPLVNVAFTGWGIYNDWNDMSPGLAITKNVASTTAGMLTGAAVTSALAGVTIVGAPVIAGVAVGALVGYGVGVAVEEWGDDVARGVSSAASTVADVAEDAWDKVTPW